MRSLPIIISVLGLAAIATAQDLRKGLVRADAVVVGRQVGKKAHGENVALHRIQVINNIRGAGAHTAVTVIDQPKLSLHIRPTPRQSRLFCLQDASVAAKRLGLAEADGPYYKLTGYVGSHPLIGKDLDKDPIVKFARVLADSEKGTSPEITAGTLGAMAINAAPAVRTEIAHLLSERPDLRSKLSSVQWGQLVARASGEVEDVEYKIALAQLCASQRLDGLLESLTISLGPVTDVRYARCVGRIGKALHGEQATAKIAERMRVITGEDERKMLLLAMGATNTKSALDALMRMDKKDKAVNAALREHRSRVARDAVVRRSKK